MSLLKYLTQTGDEGLQALKQLYASGKGQAQNALSEAGRMGRAAGERVSGDMLSIGADLGAAARGVGAVGNPLSPRSRLARAGEGLQTAAPYAAGLGAVGGGAMLASQDDDDLEALLAQLGI